VPQTGTGVPAVDLGRYQEFPALLASPVNTNSVYSDDRMTGKLTGLAQSDEQKGAFRTRGLRGVARSGPYMHAGQLATLSDVVAFYNAGGGEVPSGVTKDVLMRPLGLSTEQQADLVAFLETLTGAPVDPRRLVDISK
jgi:cytochrome c peroxidase